MKKIAVLILSVITIAGCASTPKPNATAKTEKITTPAIGSKSSSSLGDPIIVSETGVRTDAIQLGAANGATTVIRGGTFCLMPDGNFYSSKKDAVGLKNGYGDVIQDQSWVAYDPTSNEVCAIIGFSCYNSKEISIKYEKNVLCSYSDTSMKQTIEYNGKADSILKFTYREFSGDMARPAFTTDFTIDLKDGNHLAYKGAEMDIINASSSQIEYIVKKGFN